MGDRYSGYNGSVSLGGNTKAGSISFDYEESMNTHDARAFGDTVARKIPDMYTEGTFSIEALFDDATNAEPEFPDGTIIAFEFKGTSGGPTVSANGTAVGGIVKNCRLSAAANGLVRWTCSGEITAITAGTAPTKTLTVT